MIYIVEDDQSIREMVLYALNHSELSARGFGRPQEFWEAMEEKLPTMVLLDIMLPEEDGLQILQKLRTAPETQSLPVMMLTAKSAEYDKVIGLEAGADDYMTKPFGVMELVARVKALLRRTGGKEKKSGTELSYRDLEVSRSRHQVTAQGKPVTLTLKEFDLLCLLMEHLGVVMTRDQLLNQVWGYSFDGESRTVDVHVRTLRQKLGECGSYIETVRGVGYKMGGNQ